MDSPSQPGRGSPSGRPVRDRRHRPRDPAVRGRPARVALEAVRTGPDRTHAPRSGAEGPGLHSPPRGSREPPVSRRARLHRRRDRGRAHRSGPRSRGLRGRPGGGSRDLQSGRSGRRVPAGHAGLCGNPRLGREPAHRGGSRGARSLDRARRSRALLSPLLAVQEPGHLPGDRSVVPVARSREPARPGARGDRQGPLDPAVDRQSHLDHGRAAARLVPLPAAGLGGGDPGGLLPAMRGAASRRGTHPPRGRTDPRAGGGRLVRRGRRSDRPRGDALPALRAWGDFLPAGDRDPRRVVRFRRFAARRARGPGRPLVARRRCTRRDRTSIAAGSTPR